METKQIIETLKQAKKEAKKRNFVQKVDMVINLKDLDLKKNENHVDFFAQLHFSVGKKMKVCALCGPELLEEAKKVCDEAIPQTDFPKYAADKAAAKKLAESYDFFIAQANIMPQVAQTFGKVFGPRAKMPNPKAGCVVPPKATLGPLYEKLQNTVRIMAKKDPVIHLLTGNEDMKEEEVADNIKTIYNQLIHHLPGETNNVKEIFVKLSMGKPVKLN
ncbi:50S ribosomal protein L1 [Candidatus Woesearchaeota archaeon]|nr:MAG: 50S ribosomal protein L1 [Candidatus Woesearchaeota archaeon]